MPPWVLKLPLFKDGKKKTDSLFKAQTKKNETQSKGKTETKNSTEKQIMFLNFFPNTLRSSSVSTDDLLLV